MRVRRAQPNVVRLWLRLRLSDRSAPMFSISEDGTAIETQRRVRALRPGRGAHHCPEHRLQGIVFLGWHPMSPGAPRRPPPKALPTPGDGGRVHVTATAGPPEPRGRVRADPPPNTSSTHQAKPAGKEECDRLRSRASRGNGPQSRPGGGLYRQRNTHNPHSRTQDKPLRNDGYATTSALIMALDATPLGRCRPGTPHPLSVALRLSSAVYETHPLAMASETHTRLKRDEQSTALVANESRQAEWISERRS